jgi:ankyrin repeat protein
VRTHCQAVLAAAALLGCGMVANAESLVDAARAEHRDVAISLLAQHADANDHMADGTTALHWAAHNGDAELVERLIGTTPLIRAAKAGDAASIRLLLAHGAMPDLPNSLGITPLMAAAGVGSTTIDTRGRFRDEQQCIESAKLVLAAGGVDINAARDNGQTAVHGAALWGWNTFVQFLADKGANLQAADHDGMKALDVALGKVGGTGRVGISMPEPHKETAALLQKLIAANR